MSAWCLAIVPFIASAVLTPAVARFAHAHGLVDVPGGRRVHRAPVPRLGGVAIFSAVFLGAAFAVWAGATGLPLDAEAIRLGGSILFAATLLFVVGVVDDLYNLPVKWKLAAQVVAALISCLGGFRMGAFHAPHLMGLDLGFLDIPVTVLWIVGLTNAFNLIDGLDGLASGIAIVALVTTATVAGALDHPGVVLLSLLLLGAIAGFVPFNFSPARIFLGDGGSLFIGYLLSVLVLQGAMQRGDAPILYAATVLAVPILDTTLAIARRWLRGTPIFGADARHLHHRLLARGFSPRHASLVLWGSAAALSLIGCALSFSPELKATSVRLLAVLVLVLGVVMLVRLLGYHEFSVLGQVFASVPERLRREVQTKIRAWDLTQQMTDTPTLADLNALLARNAKGLGFASIEVMPQEQSTTMSEASSCVILLALRSQSEQAYCLRVLLRPDKIGNLSEAGRVVPILANAVEEWLNQRLGAEIVVPKRFCPGGECIPITRAAGVSA